MAGKLGFKIFLGLLIMMPILTLLMVFGLERNYVEQLKEEHHATLERRIVHKRAPLQQPDYDRASPAREKQVAKKSLPKPNTKPVNKPKELESDLYPTLKQMKTNELRVEKSIREMWWYVKSQLNTLKSGKVSTSDMNDFLDDTLETVKEHHISMKNWFGQLKAGSELDYWQTNVSSEMKALLENRIKHLQHPSECETAKKLVCQVGKTCGFGCQMHHVAYCFILAYASERTLVIDSSGWSYNSRGWNAVFQPVSSCKAPSGSRKTWRLDSQEQVVFLPPVDNLSPRPAQLPMAIPADLADRLSSFHGLPFAWFVGELLGYLMRPSPQLSQWLDLRRSDVELDMDRGPIVGLHVRRTDKKSEASYHDLKEYMSHVDDWYSWYELAHAGTVVQRRVYIATDEPTVLTEARSKYPDYQVYSDAKITSLASKTSTRYSEESLNGVIFDVTTLSQCDYIVCTFSSQVCRLAFELMQTRHVDASSYYYSLDDVYYFGGQQAHNVRAIQDHTPSSHALKELELETGDLVGIAGNEKNGYSVGRHLESRKRGIFPSFKVEEDVTVADFPTYSHLDRLS